MRHLYHRISPISKSLMGVSGCSIATDLITDFNLLIKLMVDNKIDRIKVN